jgi:hypothetical protein
MKEKMDASRIAWKLLQSALEQGGATVMLDGRPLPDKGYIVSLYGKGLVQKVDDIDLEKLVLWVKSAMRSGYVCLGSWADNGEVYFDVNVVIDSYGEAIRLAMAEQQKAIWDIENERSLYL